MTRLATLFVLVLALALASSTVAHAQAKPPDAATLKKANGHFKLGQEFFKSGQWDRAIAEYQAALDLTGEPLMTFNIALAHDRAGRPEQALEGYLKYLDSNPDGAIADEARGYVAKLSPIVDKLKQERAAEAARKADAERRVRDDATRQQEATKQAEATKRTRAAHAREAATLESRGRIYRIGGLVVGGVGVLAVGYGAKRGLDARRISDELSAHQGAWTDAQIARDDEGRSANTQLISFSIVGAGIAITGGVLYVLGHRALSRAEQLRLSVAPTSGGATAALRFRF